MVRTQLQLDEPTYEALRRVAHRRRISMSSLVREILHEQLSIREGSEVPRFSFIAAGASGHHDTAVRHDEVLTEIYQ